MPVTGLRDPLARLRYEWPDIDVGLLQKIAAAGMSPRSLRRMTQRQLQAIGFTKKERDDLHSALAGQGRHGRPKGPN